MTPNEMMENIQKIMHTVEGYEYSKANEPLKLVDSVNDHLIRLD